MEGKNYEKLATDMDLALFWIKHINNPCENLDGMSMKNIYLGEAKRALGTMQDLEAKKLLEDIIRKYQPQKTI